MTIATQTDIMRLRNTTPLLPVPQILHMPLCSRAHQLLSPARLCCAAPQVCKAAPIPGETRVWKYITLFKRIFLIDSPGVVYGNMELPTPTSTTEDASAASSLAALDNETTSVLKGVVRVDNLEEPAQYVPGVLQRIKRDYIVKTYGIETWSSHTDFLEQYARRTGKLVKGGGEDIQTVARMVLNDWQRGRLPYFVCPPFEEDVKRAEEAGEDERKRKEEERRMKVEQMYSRIAVRAKFDDDDMRGPTAAQAGTVDDDDDVADGKDWDKVYEATEAEEVDHEVAEQALNIAKDEQDETKEGADEIGRDDEEEEAEAAEDVEEIGGEVSEAVVRAMTERRARYHMDADEEDDDEEQKEAADDTEAGEQDEVEAERESSAVQRRTSSSSAASGGGSRVVSADGDTRPRSRKNKSRSKKNRKENEKKRKHGWK